MEATSPDLIEDVNDRFVATEIGFTPENYYS
jgi:hypothetical protein